VGIGFNEGYPEIPEAPCALLAHVKQANMFIRGSQSAKFDESIVKSGELIVYKHRISAFSENDLNLIMRAKGISELVLFGLSTSGAVLSTVRRAFDLDYRLTVLTDACDDADVEAHRVLMNNIYPKQAAVMTVDAFIGGHS
jgi:nicotinamidase-related amidase